MQVAAFAKCNHKVICADCMLRMVMLYKTMQCPLCNGDLEQVRVDGTSVIFLFQLICCPAVSTLCHVILHGLGPMQHQCLPYDTQQLIIQQFLFISLSGPFVAGWPAQSVYQFLSVLLQCHVQPCCALQVIVTPWVEPEPPDWSHWANNLHHLWHKPGWSPQIYVSPDRYPGCDQPLHEYCWKMTARACSVCDTEAERPFQTDAHLLTHVAVCHQKHLCTICLQVSIPWQW